MLSSFFFVASGGKRREVGTKVKPPEGFRNPEGILQKVAPLLCVGKEEILLSLFGQALPEGGRSEGEGEVPEGGGRFSGPQVEEGERGFRRGECEKLVRQEPVSGGGFLLPPLPELS